MPELGSGRRIADKIVDWAAFDQQAGAILKSANKVGLLTEAVDGPANAALLADVSKKALPVTHVAAHPFADDQVAEVRKAVFGVASHPTYHFEQAKVLVLTFGSDPLAGGQTSFAEQRAFAKQRRLFHKNGKARHGGQLLGI